MKAKIYLVGGAVRDLALGLVPHDYDFVAVGASEEDFQGFEMVGQDFPVFLEPTHGWEVALARLERKNGIGYTGFTCETKGVTLEEDLMRRDLTINSMAVEVDWEATVRLGKPIQIGEVIDPFGGIQDLNSKTLTNVSNAFREDPLRVLRVCRFLSKYPEFEMSTRLLNEMIACSHELDELTPERVWAEVEKTFETEQPTRFFEILLSIKLRSETQGFSFTMFEDLFNLTKAESKNDYHQEANAFVHTMMVLEDAVQRYQELPQKEKNAIFLACLMHDLGKWPTLRDTGKMHGHEKDGIPYVKDFCERFKVSKMQKEVALIMTEYHLRVHQILGRGKDKPSKPNRIMQFFESTNALKKPEQFKLMLKACESDHRGRISKEPVTVYNQRPFLEACLEAVLNYSTKELSEKLLEEGVRGPVIGQRIREQRINEIRKVQQSWSDKFKNEKEQ
ncbi:multifunctional tRNA nucleotidyl transferase [Vibrio phage Va1]|nr:multifunctional tRNA nucleotidyl transferase [Vibrio phage Va1]